MLENITYEAHGSKLIIIIDMNAETKPSSTGRSLLLASTHGTVRLFEYAGRTLSLSLNAMFGLKVSTPVPKTELANIRRSISAAPTRVTARSKRQSS